MIELILNESNEIKFELLIEGSNAPVSDIRLSLDLPLYKLSFKGEYNNGLVIFNVPNISSFVQEGVYNYKLETFIDERYFTPIEDTVSFKRPIKITSKPVGQLKETPKKLKVESTKAPEVKHVIIPVIEEKKIEPVIIEEIKNDKETDNFITKIRGILK